MRGLAPESMRIRVGHCLLDSSLSPWAHCTKLGGGHVHLEVASRVFVEQLTGETITLNLWSSNTVGDVKQLICSKDCTPPAYPHILFKHMQLDDDRSIASYGIPTESTLRLLPLSLELCLHACRAVPYEVGIDGVTFERLLRLASEGGAAACALYDALLRGDTEYCALVNALRVLATAADALPAVVHRVPSPPVVAPQPTDDSPPPRTPISSPSHTGSMVDGLDSLPPLIPVSSPSHKGSMVDGLDSLPPLIPVSSPSHKGSMVDGLDSLPPLTPISPPPQSVSMPGGLDFLPPLIPVSSPFLSATATCGSETPVEISLSRLLPAMPQAPMAFYPGVVTPGSATSAGVAAMGHVRSPSSLASPLPTTASVVPSNVRITAFVAPHPTDDSPHVHSLQVR